MSTSTKISSRSAVAKLLRCSFLALLLSHAFGVEASDIKWDKGTEWSGHDVINGETNINDRVYYSPASNSDFIPKNVSNAAGKLNVSGEGYGIQFRKGVYVAAADHSRGEINITDGGTLEHADGSTFQGGEAGPFDIGGRNDTSSTCATGIVTVAGGYLYNKGGPFRIGAGTGTDNFGKVVLSSGLIEHSATNDFSVGYRSGATGLLEITGGSAVISNSHFRVGYESSARGIVDMTGGSLAIVSNAFAGVNTASYGEMNLSGGKVDINGGAFIIGNGSSSTGLVSVSGATLAVTNRNGYIRIGNGANSVARFELSSGSVYAYEVSAGQSANSHGDLVVSGGAMSVKNKATIGVNGEGRFVVSDGTVSIPSGIYLCNKANANGSLEVSGGTVDSNSLFFGVEGEGTCNAVIGGGTGTGTLELSDQVRFASNATTANKVERLTLLPNGVLKANLIRAVNETVSNDSKVVFNGGTLKPYSTPNGTSWLQRDASGKLVYEIAAGGATFDTGVQNAKIAVPLSRAAGVAKPAITKNGAGTLTFTDRALDGIEIKVDEGAGPVVVTNGTSYFCGSHTIVDSENSNDSFVRLVYSASEQFAWGTPSIVYKADFRSAKLTVGVTHADPTATWTLTFGGRNFVGTYENGTVTFELTELVPGAACAYSIHASGGSQEDFVGTSRVAKENSGWVNEDYEHSGTGTWTAQPSYDSSTHVAPLSNNSFAAISAAGGIVTFTNVVEFCDFADTSVEITAGAKGGVRLANENNETVFQVYTRINNTPGWLTVQGEGLTPSAEEMYTVVSTFDLLAQDYSVWVGNVQLKNGGNGNFPFANSGSSIQTVEYKGSCNFKSLTGSFYSTNIIVRVSSDNVAVGSGFVSDYLSGKTVAEAEELLAPDSATKCDNGLNYFECYSLGLNPTVEMSKPLLHIVPTSDGKFRISLGNSVNPPDNVRLDIKLMSSTDVNGTYAERTDAGTAPEFTVAPSAEQTVEFFRLEIDIAGK
ncbi:MAG: hypothetical protein E7049_02545 [Lentisphaerae bacterium]|nr:hypothetical protein [Lentisphaerota bacterium]